MLERLRVKLGRPVVITSGHRCAKHNAKEGGAQNSQHIYGKAVDIYCPSSTERHEVLTAALSLGFSGVGIKKEIIHLDIREDAPVCFLY